MYEHQGTHPRDKPKGGPGLCVARALGDLNAIRAGVIPTPEITMREIAREDEYLIIASDGVWEFIDSDEAVQIVDLYDSTGKGEMRYDQLVKDVCAGGRRRPNRLEIAPETTQRLL